MLTKQKPLLLVQKIPCAIKSYLIPLLFFEFIRGSSEPIPDSAVTGSKHRQ